MILNPNKCYKNIPMKKPKGALSAKAVTKCEVSVKSKLPGAYIRKRKQKRNTY